MKDATITEHNVMISDDKRNFVYRQLHKDTY